MSDLNRNAVPRFGSATRAEAGMIDEGLRSFLLRVYNYMAVGLAVTGVAALGTAVAAVSNGQLTSFGYALYASPLKWVVMLAPLGFVFFLSARVHTMSVAGAQMAFWGFAALMGVSMSSIFLVFTGESIVRVFFLTAATFGAMSLYGYTTKRDLSGMGSFLMMGLIGIIIASLVNIFIGSSAIQFAVSVIGVLIFTGLTAYDTQQIKEMYYVGDDGTVAGRKAIMGALRLYLDFINLFMMLLQLFGNRE
ncbi:MAG: Bax inhibitor-1/YccA family protein [Rhodobiaceae bacterium]|nr:Bax inhibitor-1/YccA family protein [Rhodobiaceae bacterium]